MIANAVLHRSYLDESAIQISIFDDRVEVSSPGMLYGGIDIETAKIGKSRCRNEAIAEAFHYMHIVETWGTGIPRIINRCKEYGLAEPLFEEFESGFKVTLFRKVINDSISVSNAGQNLSNGLEKVSNALSNVSSEAQKKGNAFEDLIPLLQKAELSSIFISNIKTVFEKSDVQQIFGQKNVMNWLNCSKSKATNVMNAMKKSEVLEAVEGFGAGKYKFRNR